MFEKPLIFIDQPTAFRWDQIDLWRAAGFGGFAVLTQDGTDRVRVDEGVAFRNRARAAGFRCAQWVNLETERSFDLALAGDLASDIAPHFDGSVIDAELRTEPESCLPFLSAFTNTGPLALSTVPTFVFGPGAAAWDRRGAWLMQQAYEIENKWSCVMARDWVMGPPLNIGWWYRATVSARGRRIKLVGWEGGFIVADSIDGKLYVHPNTRSIRRTRTGKVVGKLEGLWNMKRWTPTVRTTPRDGVELDPVEARSDVVAAGNPPAGVYLGETTPEDFLRRYRR